MSENPRVRPGSSGFVFENCVNTVADGITVVGCDNGVQVIDCQDTTVNRYTSIDNGVAFRAVNSSETKIAQSQAIQSSYARGVYESQLVQVLLRSSETVNRDVQELGRMVAVAQAQLQNPQPHPGTLIAVGAYLSGILSGGMQDALSAAIGNAAPEVFDRLHQLLIHLRHVIDSL